MSQLNGRGLHWSVIKTLRGPKIITLCSKSFMTLEKKFRGFKVPKKFQTLRG